MMSRTFACGLTLVLAVLFVFPILATTSLSGTNLVDSECYLFIDIYTDPPRAHVYSDLSGNEWGANRSIDPAHGWINCPEEHYDADNCEFGFTAKKSGYHAAHHIVRVTHCRYNSESEAKQGEHIKFTMVLDPL